MTFFGAFTGVLFGIIAGVGIHLIVGAIKERRIREKVKENLKFEIDFNIKRIDYFLKELVKYRNKVNGDSLNNYFGYFHLSRVITTTMSQMFLYGTIYQYLDHDDIGKLQNFASYFSLASENSMNNQINWNKQNFFRANGTVDVNIKQYATANIDLWEAIFKQSKKHLKAIKKSIIAIKKKE